MTKASTSSDIPRASRSLYEPQLKQFGIEIHRGGFIERRCAAGDVVFVDRGGRDVVGQRIVKLRIVLLAVETAHRADGRKFDLAY